MARSLQNLPVGWFGLAMGIAGLALALRVGARVLAIPSVLAEVVAFAAVIVEAALLSAYLLKYLKHRAAVVAEFENVATLGFTGTIPISMMLVAGCLAPWAEEVAEPLWWLGAGVFLVIFIYALRRWLAGGHELSSINPGWMIAVLGGLASPLGGTPLGLLQATSLLFGLSLAVAPFIIGLCFWRSVAGPPMPDGARPSLFVFIVPPCLIYSYYTVISGGDRPFWLLGIFYLATALALVLLIASRRFFAWPFGAPWAAFTFPLDALAGAAIRHAAAHPSPLATAVAWITLALAAFFVALVSGRALAMLAKGKLAA